MAKRSAKTKKTAARRKKAGRPAARRSLAKSRTKSRAKSPAKKRKTARKAKAPTIGERVSSAFKTVTGTIADVGGLRKRLEQPGSDETE